MIKVAPSAADRLQNSKLVFQLAMSSTLTWKISSTLQRRRRSTLRLCSWP